MAPSRGTFVNTPGPSYRPITAEDGVPSEIALFRSPIDAKAVVIVMPAMGVRADYYQPLAVELSRAGFHAITADLRGHGKSGLRASRQHDFGFHEMLRFDWPAVVAAAKREFPEGPIYLLGHSLGGQLNALYASQHQAHLSGLIFIAAGSVHFLGWPFPRCLGILAFTQLARWFAWIWGYFPGQRIGFGGREARSVLRDWAHNARTGRYEPVRSGSDFEGALGRVALPHLAISLAGDRLTPRRAVHNLSRKMGRSPATAVHLGPDEMPTGGLDHFKWVRHSGPIVARIGAWIGSLPPSRA